MKKMYQKYQVYAIYIVMVICLSGCSSCNKEIPDLQIYNATDITPVSAKVEGSVVSDGNASVTQYGICFSTHSSPDITDFRTTSLGSAGSFTRKLTDLLPNTTYYAKAYATNDAGTGYSENEISFTTTEDLFSSDMEVFAGVFGFQRISIGGGTSTTGIGPGFTVNQTNEKYLSPTNSVRIIKTVIDPDTALVIGKSIQDPIPVGRDLTLEVAIKADNLEGRGISLVIRCDNPTTMKQFVTTEFTVPIKGTFDWTKFSVRLLNVQADISNVIIFLIYMDNTTGTVYFDDIKLKVN